MPSELQSLMSSKEIDWDNVDDIEWGVDDELDWDDMDEEEDILIELRNDPQPSFFVRKFAVVWWRKGFYKAGKVDGSIRVTPTRLIFLDSKGKVRLSIMNDSIDSFDLVTSFLIYQLPSGDFVIVPPGFAIPHSLAS